MDEGIGYMVEKVFILFLFSPTYYLVKSDGRETLYFLERVSILTPKCFFGISGP